LRRQGLSLGDAIQQLQSSRKAKEREVTHGR
jgi:conjugal transfer ATP-binding protein TraC